GGNEMKFGDIVVALGIIAIVMIIIIPVPTGLLSALISLNIALSILILLISMYVEDALKISIFPSLLLIATLFRLSLSISTTRAILAEGYAGKVVETFGNFVIGDNIIVGFVIF